MNFFKKKLILRYFLFLSFLFITSKGFSSFTLKERFEKAEKGDFIVTLENKTYSILLIQDIFNNKKGNKILSLSEISIPQNLVNLKTFSFREWVKKNCPRNISYNIYNIDFETNSILSCYSKTKNTFFNCSNQENFLTTLLSLPLKKISDENRKKIGPPPLDNSFDTRAIWNPPQIVNGKRQKNPGFIVYQTVWPKDGTDLSGKTVDLYFDKNEYLPFPYWIQISNGNIDVILKIIDSGKNLSE